MDKKKYSKGISEKFVNINTKVFALMTSVFSVLTVTMTFAPVYIIYNAILEQKGISIPEFYRAFTLYLTGDLITDKVVFVNLILVLAIAIPLIHIFCGIFLFFKNENIRKFFVIFLSLYLLHNIIFYLIKVFTKGDFFLSGWSFLFWDLILLYWLTRKEVKILFKQTKSNKS